LWLVFPGNSGEFKEILTIKKQVLLPWENSTSIEAVPKTEVLEQPQLAFIRVIAD
jgi:hypothetical protein